MGTRSNIAYELPDGTVREIYCHWDGYRSYNGRILFHHYNSAELADELTRLGNISALKETVAGTIAYHRDRGKDLEIKIYANYNKWRKNGRGQRIAYIFREGCWWDCTSDRRKVNVRKDYTNV